jgi:hypothetical protein
MEANMWVAPMAMEVMLVAGGTVIDRTVSAKDSLQDN